jgi:TolB-like protein
MGKLKSITGYYQFRLMLNVLLSTILLSALLLQSGCTEKVEQGKVVNFGQSMTGIVHSFIDVELADGSVVQAWLPDDDKIWDEMYNFIKYGSGEKFVQIKYNRSKKYWQYVKVINEGININYFTGSDKSIAVLPMINLSKGGDQEYISDSLVNGIVAQLSKINDLKVISQETSMKYKNTNLSLKEIAGELGVSAILEGSVQNVENRVHVAVQLYNVRLDQHLWSEMYDFIDSSNAQNDIAQKIADQVSTFFK